MRGSETRVTYDTRNLWTRRNRDVHGVGLIDALLYLNVWSPQIDLGSPAS